MKNTKHFLFVITLLVSVFISKSQTPGVACANALTVTASGITNNIKQPNSSGWFKFVADASGKQIDLINLGGASNYKIKKIIVAGGSCTGIVPLAMDSISATNDTLLSVSVSSLTIGNTYYLKTIKQDSTDCSICAPDTAYYNLSLSPLCSYGCTVTWDLGMGLSTGSIFNTSNPSIPVMYAYLLDGCPNSTLNVGFKACGVSSTPSTTYVVSVWTSGIPASYNFTYTGGVANGAVVNFTAAPNPTSTSCFVTYTIATSGFSTSSAFSPPTSPTDSTYCGGFLIINIWKNPSASFTLNPTPACASTSVCFNGAPNCSIYDTFTYSVYNPLSTLTGSNACTSTSLAPGTYSVDYLVYSNLGMIDIACTAMTTQTFVISPNPTVNISASPPTICPGQYTTLTASGAVTYTWFPGSIVTNPFVVNPTVTTTYTVIGANAAGCIKTKTITVFVTPPITINATASPTIVCPGKSTTLTASGAFSYTWNPGFLPGNSVVVTPTANTIYTVTGITASGCVGTKTVLVTVAPNPTITISATQLYGCALGGYPNATLTATGANTYTWSPLTSFTSTLSIPSYTAGVYTVIGTSVFGCTNTATFTFTTIDCCTSCSINISSPTTYASSNVVSAKTICVNFPITLASGANITFDGCELKMAPNVTITVMPTATLNIKGSHLYACNNMWKGIDVQSGGVINVISNGSGQTSLIEDAFIAVNVQTSTLTATNILTANNATFNKNQVSIKLNGYPVNQNSYPFTIVSCLFTSRTISFSPLSWPLTNTIKSSPSGGGPLQTPYITNSTYPGVNLKAPLNTSLPTNGIIINNVGLTTYPFAPAFKGMQIGQNGNPNYNLFDNLYECITANNSNFTVINSVFQNGQRFGKGNSSGGKAIYAVSTQSNPTSGIATNNQIRVIPGAGNNNFHNKFYEFTRCVDVKGYLNTEIRGNEAYSFANAYSSFFTPNAIGGLGFTLSTNRYYQILITENKMYNIKNNILFDVDQGFYLVGPKSGTGRYIGHANFDNNIINRHPVTAAANEFVNIGVNVNDPFAAAPYVLAPVGGNTLTIASNSMTNVHNGIGSNNVTFCLIHIATNTLNLVNEPNTFLANPAQSGINTFQLGKGNNIWQNNITGPSTYTNDIRGIKTSMNSNLSVRCNSVNNTVRAMDFNASQAATTVEDNVMQITGTSTLNSYGLSLDNNALISTQGSPTYPQDNQWLGANWFPSSSTMFKTLTVGAGSSALFSMMYIRTSPFPTILDPNGSSKVLGTASFNLDDYFHNSTGPNTLLSATFSVAPTCRLSSGGSGNKAAQKALMEQLVTNAIAYPVNASEIQFIDKNRVYRTIKDDNSWMASSTILNNFYNTSQTGCLQDFCDIENELMTGTSVTAQVKINAFTPSSNIETNYKNYFQVLLNVQGTSYNSSDSTALITLANSCPFTEGGCVYQARALYNIIYKNYFSYNDNCNANVNRMNNSDLNGSVNEINVILKSKIYPNPNSGDLYISITDIQEKQNIEIQIFDVTGKIVYSGSKTTSGNIVNLQADLANGIYLVKVKLSDSSADVHRLIINK